MLVITNQPSREDSLDLPSIDAVLFETFPLLFADTNAYKSPSLVNMWLATAMILENHIHAETPYAPGDLNKFEGHIELNVGVDSTGKGSSKVNIF